MKVSEAEVRASVASEPNLNSDQRAIVSEMALAVHKKQGGLAPNVKGIANYVRSQVTHIGNQERPYPTNSTLQANNGKI